MEQGTAGNGFRGKSSPKNNLTMRQVVTLVVCAVGIFSIGWLSGSGRLRLDSNSFSQSVSRELPADLDYTSVEEVYDQLRRSFDGELTAEDLLNGLKDGLAQASGDAYTEYLTAEEANEFDQELSGTFSGIGAELSKKDGAITVIAPLAGYPAEKAGLRARDVIAEIDGESAFDLTLTEAVKRIRGPKGTTVSLKIFRGGTEEVDLTIERDDIAIPSVEWEKSGDVGIIAISRFGEDTSELTRKAATELKQQGIRSVVLDLRNNPGGLLNVAVDVASVWVDGGTILTERRGDMVVRTFEAKGRPILNGVPTVVLINGGSASASEIVAGALKDNGVATLVGEKSYGKGSVQQIEGLRHGGALKVTVARWFTPEGKNIDEEGIEPDQKVELTQEDYEADRDPQLDAAKAKLAR